MFIVAFNVAKVIEFRSLSRRCWSYDAFKDVLCGFVRAGGQRKTFSYICCRRVRREIETRHGWHSPSATCTLCNHIVCEPFARLCTMDSFEWDRT